MSWSGLASNQTISCDNLQDAVNTFELIQKNTIPSSNKLITKAEADYYVFLNTSAYPYASKSSNQLLVKSDIVTTVVSYVYYICAPVGDPNFFLGCPAGYPGTAYTVYSNNPSFISSPRFYTDSGLTNPFNGYSPDGSGNSWYMDSTFESGTIIQINSLGYNAQQYGC